MKSLLPILADIANGIFATVLAGYISGTEIVWWHFLIGIPLAMLPDVDAIPELLKRGKVGASSAHAHDHRETLHYPILFIVGGVILMAVVPFWGWLFLLATMLHFVNDLYGTGWGIPLFGPFSSRRYKFFARKVGQAKSVLQHTGQWESLSEDQRKLRVLVSWSKEELPTYITTHGNDNWIGDIYMRFNWISGIEYVVFFGSLIVLVVTLLY